MKIVVLDGFTTNPGDLSWEVLGALGEVVVYDKTADDKIIERAAEAEIVVTNKTLLRAGELEQLPKLRYICEIATGYNNIDVEAAAARGIAVSNVPAYSTASVAQYTFALLLELCHRIGHHGERVRRGAWAASEYFSFWDTPQVELEGKTLGIVGFGRIGSRVAAIADAVGMSVLATTRSRKPAPPLRSFAWADLETLFARSDVVSLHCPLTSENERFVNGRLLSTMKPAAFLINTARGGLIDEPALVEALHAGRLAGAALDVLTTEPPKPGDPLIAAKNCIVTPHIAWATRAARARLIERTVENIRAFQAGQPVNVVNKIR